MNAPAIVVRPFRGAKHQWGVWFVFTSGRSHPMCNPADPNRSWPSHFPFREAAINAYDKLKYKYSLKM